MIIDSHTHIFPAEIITARDGFLLRDRWFNELYGHPKAKMVDGPGLVRHMDKAGVDISVACNFGWSDMGLCRWTNDALGQAVREQQGRLVGFGAVNPGAGIAAAREAERCFALGLRGIGEIYPDGQAVDLENTAAWAPLVETLVAYQAPLLLHCSEPVGHLYPGKGTATPEKIFRFVSRWPDLKVICAHWGGGLPFYELMPEVAKALQNVYYDTAATTYLYDFAIFAAVCRITGPGKILWASDYPVLNQAKLLARVGACALSPEQQTAILGENTRQLLRL